MFVNNKLENNTIEIFCKSFDEEETLLNFKTVKKSDEVSRMDLRYMYIRLIHKSDGLNLEGYINIDSRLRDINESFTEMLIKQFIIKMFNNLERARINPKIVKNIVNTHSKEFYDYYSDVINKKYQIR
jgi:hypothetical protein